MHNKCETLQNLLVYRNILTDELIVKLLTSFSDEDNIGLKYEISADLIKKGERLGLSGDLIKKYLIHLIINDENIFSITAERSIAQIGTSLYQAAIQDITVIRDFLTADSLTLPSRDLISQFEPTQKQCYPSLDALYSLFTNTAHVPSSEIADTLADHYRRYGYGAMANYIFFRWTVEEGLVGIAEHDPITLSDIVGYERQKKALTLNTEAFLKGKPCNNVLLIGARGTGKSSSVKALANCYADEGLRLIEVAKHDLRHLPTIIATLRNIGKKFILFLDDLSFEEHESEYKQLKSILEGSAQAKPSNVLIFATSNRRHLIRETWGDRNETSDEVHRFDTVNEKVSLSDRFGLTLSFLSPSQEEYFNIIEELAKKKQLDYCPNKLRAEAIKWEMSHSGRSGRTAQQLISHLQSLIEEKTAM